MSTFDPSVLGLLVAVMAVAAGVLLLGRHLDLLEQRASSAARPAGACGCTAAAATAWARGGFTKRRLCRRTTNVVPPNPPSPAT
jgi:hypothetical protein